MCGGTTLDRDDSQLSEAIERYPLTDERGESPYSWDTSTTPPTKDDNVNWYPTYDLCAAAADIWSEIAATYVGEFDFATNDQKFDRSQKHKQAMAQVRHYRARRAPTSINQVGTSKSDDGSRLSSWVVNLPEED